MNRDAAETAFVGLPWRVGANGPYSYDCWQLIKTAALTLYGLKFPDFPYTSATPSGVNAVVAAQRASGNWERIDHFEEGAVLALSGVADAVTHVALVVSCNRALHSSRQTGSQLIPIPLLTQFYTLEGIYRWAQ